MYFLEWFRELFVILCRMEMKLSEMQASGPRPSSYSYDFEKPKDPDGLLELFRVIDNDKKKKRALVSIRLLDAYLNKCLQLCSSLPR